MKKILTAIVLSSALLGAPASAGSLNDPIVTPLTVTTAAEESSGGAMVIVVLTGIVMLAVSMN